MYFNLSDLIKLVVVVVVVVVSLLLDEMLVYRRLPPAFVVRLR